MTDWPDCLGAVMTQYLERGELSRAKTPSHTQEVRRENNDRLRSHNLLPEQVSSDPKAPLSPVSQRLPSPLT